MLPWKYAKLRGEIRAKYKTQKDFAEALPMRISTLNAKLNGKSEWRKDEILRVCDVLRIPIEEIPAYFFTD